MAKGSKGFQKGHADFVSEEARKRAGLKIAIAQKGKIASLKTRKKQSISAIKRGANRPRTGQIITCPICGKKKYKYPRDLKRVKTNYCSIDSSPY